MDRPLPFQSNVDLSGTLVGNHHKAGLSGKDVVQRIRLLEAVAQTALFP